jgi:hypothetical protein
MPTATAPIPIAPPVISADLWRAYRRARAAHPERVPSYAAGVALDELGITADRGRLERLLGNREVEEGLRPSRAEGEADDVADAAAREAARAAMVDGSVDAIEIDASKRVDELKVQIERMAVEALTDANVASEQKTALSELAEAELALENVKRARPEMARREAEAAEKEAQKARDAAMQQARELQPQIRKAAERVDTAAGVLAECVVGYRDLKEAQTAALAAAGRGQEAVRQRSYRASRVGTAVDVTLRDRGVKIDGFDGGRHAAPLASEEMTEEI